MIRREGKRFRLIDDLKISGQRLVGIFVCKEGDRQSCLVMHKTLQFSISDDRARCSIFFKAIVEAGEKMMAI